MHPLDLVLTSKIVGSSHLLALKVGARPPQGVILLSRAASVTDRGVAQLRATTKPLLITGWGINSSANGRIALAGATLIETAGAASTPASIGGPMTAVCETGLRDAAVPGAAITNIAGLYPWCIPIILAPGEVFAIVGNIDNTLIELTISWWELELG